jgi:hypothetical protein
MNNRESLRNDLATVMKSLPKSDDFSYEGDVFINDDDSVIVRIVKRKGVNDGSLNYAKNFEIAYDETFVNSADAKSAICEIVSL